MDGGCGNFKATWMQNPTFCLTVEQKSTVKLVVEAESIQSAIGYYLFTTQDGKKVLKMMSASPFVQGTKNVSVEKDWELVPGKYLVMPTTFESKRHGNFVLTSYTDHSCNLTPV